MDEEIVEVATRVAFSFKPMVLVAASVVSLAAGGGIGYFVAKRQLTTKYEALAEEEINQAREYYKRLNKQEEYSTPEQAAAALSVPVDSLTVEVPADVVEVIKEYAGKPVDANIFEAPPVPAAILTDRDTSKPYVISQDEWNESNYQPVELTYYAGDDALADERDQLIDDRETMIGAANLLRFGDSDPDQPEIVLVRNDAIQIDYEITRSMGRWSVEVAGLDELQHSSYPAKRRRRDE